MTNFDKCITELKQELNQKAIDCYAKARRARKPENIQKHRSAGDSFRRVYGHVIALENIQSGKIFLQ